MGKMVKVWNVTDHPKTKVDGTDLMLFGRLVSPGRFVLVPEDRLRRAHKVEKDKANGLVHVGSTLPKDYLLAKGRVRAQVAPDAPRAHGKVKPAAKKAPALAKKAEEPKKAEPKEEAKKDSEKKDEDGDKKRVAVKRSK